MHFRVALLVLGAALALPSLPAAEAAAPPPRAFGAYIEPAQLAGWTTNVGAAPQFVARFEAFSRGETVDPFLRESEAQGLRRVLVTWEPWKPVPADLGIVEQFREQPGYSNRDIADGVQDSYILAFARSLATFQGRVDLRFAHEMNGTWYPWSHDPIQYRRAWRHIVRLFRSAGARNVRFVWSVNPSLYVPMRAWQRSTRVYWPGSGYVDAVGSTMINFGGAKQYPVSRFVPRLRALRRLYRKPVMLTELSTAYRGRERWLRNLRRMLRTMPWIRSIAWFQHTSRGQVQLGDTGRLDWDVQEDPAAAAQLRRIIRDGQR